MPTASPAPLLPQGPPSQLTRTCLRLSSAPRQRSPMPLCSTPMPRTVLPCMASSISPRAMASTMCSSPSTRAMASNTRATARQGTGRPSHNSSGLRSLQSVSTPGAGRPKAACAQSACWLSLQVAHRRCKGSCPWVLASSLELVLHLLVWIWGTGMVGTGGDSICIANWQQGMNRHDSISRWAVAFFSTF